MRYAVIISVFHARLQEAMTTVYSAEDDQCTTCTHYAQR